MSGGFDLGRYQDALTIQRVIHGAKTIAIVGLSNNELRASYFVGFYLRRHGYRVIPVNPREAEILGEKSYKSLKDVPVRDYAIAFNKDAAAARQLLAACVESLNCDCGRFNAANELGKKILRGVCLWKGQERERK